MRNSLAFISLLLFAFFAKGFTESIPIKNAPLAELELLIGSTENLVKKQKAVKELLEHYLSLHDAYLKEMENKELLLKCAKIASEALERIKQERLSPLFEPSFLSEMTLFAKLASKPSIPKIDL